MKNMLQNIREDLRRAGNKDKARILQRFFKTGKGEYGEGDIFLGVVVPDIRRVVKRYADAPEPDVKKLLYSKFHEERLCAVLVLVEQYKHGDERDKKKIFDFYIKHKNRVNNWDLVDLSAHHIVGAYLEKGNKNLLYTTLAKSKNLWDRRIAVLSTFHSIKQGDSKEALKVAQILLHDSHDLIHKAVGWMLREVGKRCSLQQEEQFLKKYAHVMPRIMLRYAIERFPLQRRQEYLR